MRVRGCWLLSFAKRADFAAGPTREGRILVDGFSEFNSLVKNGDTVFAGSKVFVGAAEVAVIPEPAYSITLAGLAGLA